MPIVDPRANINHEIQEGQTYKDSRSSEVYELCYLDEGHGLLKSVEDQSAVLILRKDLDKYIGAGRYKIQGNVEMTPKESHTPINFIEIDGVGQVAADGLHAAGFTTVEDVQQATRVELLACRGIGEGNLSNILSHIDEIV